MESEHAGDAGASTLVLIQDAEFELHASRSSIVFPAWGSLEAKGKKRSVIFSISLLANTQDHASASVPLVITAPFTSRFVIRSCGGSLIPLLHTGAPLQFEVEFVPPCDQADIDLGFDNFQDQVIIQTRLAKLCIRLHALREGGSTDLCAPESFTPRVLPTMKAPSFKLFDQIERDAASATVNSHQRPISSGHRVSVSGSFHPHKNDKNQLDSLSPLPPRQPTPPQQYAVTSRPLSSSSRRTPSPRVLEPLVAPPVPSISAAVDNQVEAREIILRLRARRSSQNSAPVKTEQVNNFEPTSPEIQLDAKTKAELDQFNALVKAAKVEVADERSKAKQELDFYKSLLPGQPPTGATLAGQPLPPRVDWNTPDSQAPTQKGLPNKQAKLQALPSKSQVSAAEPVHRQQDGNQSVAAVVVSTTNQETSPIKRAHSKQVTKVSRQPLEASEAAPRRKQPFGGGDKVKAIDVLKTPKAAVPVLVSKSSSTKSSPSMAAKAPMMKSTGAQTKPAKPASKTMTKIAQVSHYDHALDDFDDADPEIDEAPVFPDDLRAQRRLRDEEDEDDPMLTMKVPLY